MQISARAKASETTLSTLEKVFAAVALTGLITTILLIMMGSIVRVTGHGLGCPDWPLCYGQAIPPLKLGAWVEFTHRLFGGAVVLQVVALIVLALRYYRRKTWMYRTAVAAGFILTIQVILGGIHVIYELPRWTGWVHTGVAMLVAAIVAVWVALTRPSLQRLSARIAKPLAGTRLPFWVGVTAVFTYVLLLTGSLVTRTGAGYVCNAFPDCGVETASGALPTIALIHMTHRFSAYIVAFGITLVLWYLVRAARQETGLRNFALALAGLLVLQFGLGITNVLFSMPMWSRVLHLGTGATIWVVVVMLWIVLNKPPVQFEAQERT